MRDGLHYHRLEPADGGSRFTIGQVGDDLDQARSAIAGSLAHYVAEHDVERLRICAAADCRWRFIDSSPAGRRRWCDMRTCGNRAKVAAHRARTRTASV
jgi:predicted RNA-binding Zn ribbon-like protein